MTFQTDPEGAGKRINHWVGELTKGKIRELFSPGSLSTDTSVLVITTTYFEGNFIYSTYDTYECPLKFEFAIVYNF